MALSNVPGNNLGDRLRNVRKEQKLSLQEVADQTGLSRAFVSQVERGKVSPSVVSVSKIAEALKLSVRDVLMPPRTKSEGVVRADKRIKLAFTQEGTTDELLSPSLHGKTLNLLCEIKPGTSSGDLYRDEAGEECVVVFQGLLEMRVEDSVFMLAPGDSLTFQSHRPHGWSNPGDADVIALWAITPPTF